MFNHFQLSDTADYQYLISVIGKDVLLNGSPVKALITNTNLEQNYDDKRISSLSQLQRGDIVEYDGKPFMIISEQAGKRYNKYKGIMRLLPHEITINSSCQFVNMQCYVVAKNFNEINGQVITMADGTIYVSASLKQWSDFVKLSDRFLLHGQAWKITGIDTYSKDGMVILTCEKDVIAATDDVVNGIAGGLACNVSITNNQPVQVYEGQTIQLTWNSHSAPVTFNSNNTNIATVSDTGLVSGVQLGQVNITISNATNSQISQTVTLNVLSVPVAYTVNITSTSTTPNEIKNGQSKTYNAEVLNGTTLVSGENVSWSLYADDQTNTTTLATITSQNGTSCTVKNNNANSGYVQLRATLQSDNSVIAWKRIQLKPLF